MKVFKNTSDLRAELKKNRLSDKRIGLVPTMGALHEGHLSLVKTALENADIVAVSIFVNPTQFNNPTDLEKYPRDIEKDLNLLEKAGCHIVFTPPVEEIYPFEHDLSIGFGKLESELEGKFRPGHFRGVGLVVSKLFNIFQPDIAFFGQKDIQQFFIIKRLVQQLSFPIELNMVPTMREANGLAMSSRNERLSPADREHAALISQALKTAATNLQSGITLEEVKSKTKELFERSERLELEYFEVVETKNFTPISHFSNQETIAMCIAAEIGQVRLIDNLLLNY